MDTCIRLRISPSRHCVEREGRYTMNTIVAQHSPSPLFFCYALFLALIVAGSVGAQSAHAREASRSTAVSDGLRGVYYATGSTGRAKERVARLAIELTEGSGAKTVRTDHLFRTGDRFRFKVNSNQGGWLYIMHRTAGGEPQLLWPRVTGGKQERYLDQNRIEANQTYTVPAAPGLFVFDEEVGDEIFYALIAAERSVPQLAALDAREHKLASSPAISAKKNSIVNFAIRSGTSGTVKPLRGVIYDPGREDKDPFLYFSAPSGDDTQPVLVEFRLKHK